MAAMNITRFRETLKESLELVVSNHEPLIVTRPNGENVVVMSYADFSAVEETSYLLRSPVNARRLAESLQSFRDGKGRVLDLIEVEP